MIEAEIYRQGNPWQNKVYQRMAEFLIDKGVTTFGKSKGGKMYKHLLRIEQAELNFITKEIFKATEERFDDHKAGDSNRALTNTAASQPYCFNLVIYLNQHKEEIANKLFSKLLEKNIFITHIEPEFTPNKTESIGDQSEIGGTDADIAVFYTYENDKKGVLLIEFKFIEAEFSVCSSYKGSSKKKDETHQEKEERIRKTKEIQTTCSSIEFYPKLLQTKENSSCGYKRKYDNWELTENSKVIDINKIISSSACPFRFGLNQLWRNMLLAEQVARARKLDEFGFWVLSPSGNDEYLWKQKKSEKLGETEKQFRNILTDQGNNQFRKVYLDSIFDELRKIVSEINDKAWLSELEKKYRIQ